MNTVYDPSQTSKMAVIIMQIRRPLTLRLIIIFPTCLLCKYELHSCLDLIAKYENYGSPSSTFIT